MNLFVCILVIFALIGLIDCIFQNRFHLGQAMEAGIRSMGSFCFSILGFYCVLTTLTQHIDVSALQEQPVLCALIGSLLAPDLGGFSLIHGLTADPDLLFFTGVVLTSTLGCTISFQFPVFLGQLKSDELPLFMDGIADGLLALAPVLFVIGICIQPVMTIPLLILYAILAIGLHYRKAQTIRCLCIFAKSVQRLGLIFFGIVIVSLIFCQEWISTSVIQSGLVVIFQICLIVAGANVLCELLQRHGTRLLQSIGKRFHLSNTALMGLFLSLGSSLAMIPLYSSMDEQGKRINAAFSVSGAYALGGQMGFIAAMTDTQTTFFFILIKLIGGILAVIWVQRHQKKSESLL